MTLRVITAPTVEPITVAEAQAWLRVDDDVLAATGQTAWLSMVITAMRNYAENLTGRAFVQRTLELTQDCWPEGGEFRLPLPPLVSVTHVKYYDLDDALQTVTASDYEVDTYAEPGRVRPVSGVSWPGLGTVYNRVQVRYVAGYAPTGSPTDYAENVPAELKQWMAARVATLWESREQLASGNWRAIPRNFADGLLDTLVVGTRYG